MLAPQGALHPAVDEPIQAHGRAAPRVQYLAHGAAGGSGDHRADVGLPDQLVHIHAREQRVDIDLVEQARQAATEMLDKYPAEAEILLDRWFGGRADLLKA